MSEATGCWTWDGRHQKCYPRYNIRVSGRHIEINPCRAVLVLMELGADSDWFWELYEQCGAAELEADHLCYRNSLCINPDHLQWLTKAENTDKRWQQVHPDSFADKRQINVGVLEGVDDGP